MTTHAASRARPQAAGRSWLRSRRLRTYFTVSVLEELGVHFGQGFHLGRPVPPEHL